MAEFAAFAPTVQPLPPPTNAAGAIPKWEIGPTAPFLHPSAFSPLDAALRQANFDASVLLAGAYEGFASRLSGSEQHYGVPTFAIPWGVQYDASVFQTVDLPDPSPDWTIDAFEDCCAAVAAAIRAGRLPQLQSVMPPLVGSPTRTVKIGSKTVAAVFFATFTDAGLQGAFVAGFGGTVVHDGRFDLTNAGAVAGLQRMADIARLYGQSANQPVVGLPAIRFAKAVTGSPAVAALPDAKPWRWARLPRFPVSPVIPVDVGGVTATRATPSVGSLLIPPPGVPEGALLAIAEYALWQYDRALQTLPAPGLAPPAVADPSAQRRYWSAPRLAADGYATVGDWQHFRLFGADWPMVANSPGTPIYTMLTRAAETGTPVADLVAETTRQLNVGLKPPGVGAASSSAS